MRNVSKDRHADRLTEAPARITVVTTSAPQQKEQNDYKYQEHFLSSSDEAILRSAEGADPSSAFKSKGSEAAIRAYADSAATNAVSKDYEEEVVCQHSAMAIEDTIEAAAAARLEPTVQLQFTSSGLEAAVRFCREALTH